MEREEHTERDFLEFTASHWQTWSAHDYQFIETWREIADHNDLIVSMREQAEDSTRARKYLFELIDMGKK